MNILLKTIAVLCITISLQAMEQNFAVQIVDQNNGQTLAEHRIPGSLISVFGATPRYSSFVRFIELLREHLIQLNIHFSRSKRLKHVPRIIEHAMKSFRSTCATSPAEVLDALPFQAKVDLFLRHGLKQRLLRENFKSLMGHAQGMTNQETTHNQLVHLFLPSYFDDCNYVGQLQECPWQC